MGLLDRFKKGKTGEKETSALPPEADTAGKLLFTRERLDGEELREAVTRRFGPEALGELSQDHPVVTSFLVRLEGVEFWCAHMALPLPPEEGDISRMLEYSPFLNQEERTALAEQKSFLLVAQKGGGTTLEKKRTVCRLFTRLCGALMELEGAAAYLNNSAYLLVGRQFYLRHAAILEQNLGDPEYFPAPLWIALSQADNHGHTAIGTDGLSAFGFPELFFLDPREEWASVYQKLWLMSIFQITGKAVYREGDTIAFDPDKPPAVVKRLQDRLAVIGG